MKQQIQKTITAIAFLLWVSLGMAHLGMAQAQTLANPSVTGLRAVCTGTGTTLTASGDNGATFAWYDAATGGNLLSSSAIYTTNNLTIPTHFYLQQTVGGNTSARTDVYVLVNSLPSLNLPVGVAVSPSTICQGSSANLSANVDVTTGQYVYWYDAPLGGNLIGSSASGANFSVSPMASTTYYAQSQNQPVVNTYNYTGGVQTFTVPEGVTSITIDAQGGKGGGYENGGKGGRVQAIMNVTPGQVLNLYVGGAGTFINAYLTYAAAGGYNGGGAGNLLEGDLIRGSGSGGGATDIRLGQDLVDRILVAGGGGGASSVGYGGAGGGLAGANGTCVYSAVCVPSNVGGGGTQTAGGVGATGGGGGYSGAFGIGGQSTSTGCGGGGGWYGGGGSSTNSGAGGGSSYANTAFMQNIIHTQGVRDGNGILTISYNKGASCAANTRVPVTLTVNTTPTVSAGANVISCLGTAVSMTATGADTYVWQPGGLTGASVSVNPASTTSYTVTGTLTSGGCTNTSTKMVTVNSVSIAGNQKICIGQSATLTASGADSYTWQPGGLTGPSVSVAPTSTTTYTVTGYNNVGCNTIATSTITVNQLPTVNAGPDVSICAGSWAILTATGADTYNWSNISSTSASLIFSPAETSTYTLTGTNSTTGCQNSDQVVVTVSPIPSVSGNTTICSNGQAVLTASGISGAYNYWWYNEAGRIVSSSASFTTPPLLTNTTYFVERNGSCKTQVNVRVNDPVPTNVSATPSLICSGQSSTLKAIKDGSVRWYTAQTGGTLLGTTQSGVGINVSPAETTTYWAEGFTTNESITFNYTGGVQTFTVPEGVTSIAIDAQGAKGGANGGKGGRVQTSMNVYPGQVYYLYVGGAGVYIPPYGPGQSIAHGGYNGGGDGKGCNCSGDKGGGGGGGATDIRIRLGQDLVDRILVAGGGGGGTSSGTLGGAGGGLIGADGGCYRSFLCTGNSNEVGKGGTQTAGGAGGYNLITDVGRAGSGTFGTGGNSASLGGGGGAGWYGGGGSRFELASAGGGSSYANPAMFQNVVHTQGVRDGNGVLTISYNTNCEYATRVPVTVTIRKAGTVIGSASHCLGTMAQYTSNGDAGGSWSSSNTAVATVNSVSGLVTAESVGTVNIIYTVCGLSAIKEIIINPLPQGSLATNTNTVFAGQSFKFIYNATSGTGPYDLVINGLSYPGVISGTAFNVMYNPMVTTTYTLSSVTDANGCVRTSDFTVSAAVVAVTCANNHMYPAAFDAPVDGAGPLTISYYQWQRDYNQMTGVLAGHSFQSTASIAGTWITVRTGIGTSTIVAQGSTPLNWTAAAGGDYFIDYNANSACGTAYVNMTTTVENISVGCTNSQMYPGAAISAPEKGAGLYTIATNQVQQQYNQMTGVLAGSTFQSTASIAGTWITVRTGSAAGPLVAKGSTPLNWTAADGGDYFIHYNANSLCGIAQTNMTTTVENTTPACAATLTQYPETGFTAPVYGAGPYFITPNQYQQEYNKMTGVLGCNATYRSTASITGTWITVRAGTATGTVVAQGSTPLDWMAAAGGDYFIHYNTNSDCGRALLSMLTSIECTSPGGNLMLRITRQGSCQPGSQGFLAVNGTAASMNPWTSSNPNLISVENNGQYLVNPDPNGTAATITFSGTCGTATYDFNLCLPYQSNDTTVCKGDSIALSGSGNPAIVNPWVSSNTEIATVDDHGIVKGLAPGWAVISYRDDQDSLTTRKVTVNQTSYGTTMVQSCVSYDWPSTGLTYTSSGTYISDINENCFYEVLELTILSPKTWYLDADLDGYYVNTVQSCESPGEGYRTKGRAPGDCNDFNSNIHPLAAEVCDGIDNNCDGIVDFGPLEIPTSINGSAALCRSQSFVFTTDAAEGASAYQWTLPAGMTGTSTGNSIAVTTSSSFAGGSICVIALNGCGTFTPPVCKTLSVVTTSATPGVISGNRSVCANSTQSTYSIAAVANASNYIWTAPANATLVSGQGTTSAIFSFQSAYTSGSISVRSANCLGTSSARTLSVYKLATPATPGKVTGPASFCPNTQQTFSIAAVTNASNYTWTAPANASIVSGQGSVSVVVEFTSAFVSGNVTVVSSNCTGTSAARTKAVTRTTLPGTVGTISGLTAGACSAETRTYTVAALTNTTSYEWIAPINSSIVSGQGSTTVVVQFAAGFTTGTLSVKGVNCSGISATARTLAIANTTATPATLTGPSSAVCAGSTQTYSTTAVNGATNYAWSVPSGAVMNGATNGTSISVTFPSPFTSGAITVKSATACYTSAAKSLTVSSIIAQPGTITGTSTNLCSGGSFTYSIAAVTGATGYFWNIPAGWITTANTGTSITLSIPTTGFTSNSISVVAQNACGYGTARSLTLSAFPSAPASVSGPALVCASATGLVYSTPVVAGTTNYTWSVPAGASITAGFGTSSITAKWGTVAGNVTVKAGNACGTNTSAKSMAVALTTACREALEEEVAETVDETILLYPNPASQMATLNFSSAKEGVYQIRVINALGQSVYSSEGKAIEGSNAIELNLEKFSSGLYIVQLVKEGSMQQVNLIKR